MSYFERVIAGFLKDGEKITVDSATPDRLPVSDDEARDLLEEIRDNLVIMNQYLAEIVGEELTI